MRATLLLAIAAWTAVVATAVGPDAVRAAQVPSPVTERGVTGAAPNSLVVASSRGERPVAVRTERGFPAVAAADLGAVLSIEATTPRSGTASLHAAGRQYDFVLDAAYFTVGGRVFGLAAPAYLARDSLFVPLQFLVEYLPRLAADRYRYDPADPTPAAGGVRLSGTAGRVDNSALEARDDVRTYTTDRLDRDVEVIGEVSAEIWFRSSLPYADVFVRLCDVSPRGRSRNVCDGLVSLSGADEVACATVRLWPTAHRFKAGHRIRVQVSSGAFPRYARNPGTGEARATAAVLRPAGQEVYHDRAHPSAIILPVRAARPVHRPPRAYE